MSFNFNSTNFSALLSASGRTQTSIAKSSERLSSGLRINSASDDPAALSLASKTSVEARLYSTAVRSINDGISLMNVANAAINEMQNIGTRLYELSTQATSEAITTSQRAALDEEAQALRTEYERIRTNTTYNGISIFPPATTTLAIQAGVTANSAINLTLGGGTGTNTDFQSTVTEENYSGQLSAGVTYGGGVTSMTGFTAADLNGDGNIDLVSAGGNGASARSIVYLGNGDGTFAAGVTYNIPSAGNPFIYNVAAEDFDGDGDRDLMMTSIVGLTDVHWLLKNNGDGTFAAAVSTTDATGGFVRPSYGDIDQDGDIDWVAPHGAGTGGRVGINDGTGVFTMQNSPFLQSNTNGSGLLGDFNNDGDLDYIHGNNTGVINLNIGGAGENFGFPTTVSGSGNVNTFAAGDFNGDGNLDFVANNGAAGSVGVFLGNGDGTFAARLDVTTGTAATRISVVDITNDGNLDIVVGGSTMISVIAGNGDGTFQAARTVASPANSVGISTADFNGDGVADVVNQTASNGLQYFANAPTISTTTSDFSLTTVERAAGAKALFENILSQLSIEYGRSSASTNRLSSGLTTAEAMRSEFTDASQRIREADVATELGNLLSAKIQGQTQDSLFAHSIKNARAILSLFDSLTRTG